MAVSSALQVVSRYVEALAGRNTEGMNGLRTEDFELDFVHGDAFPELDLEVTRTVAADEVVVTQWIFTGTIRAPWTHPFLKSG